ncbi:MAG: hypothetical protein WCD18_21455 [Thermosynechococcaceae cyanobacterium]
MPDLPDTICQSDLLYCLVIDRRTATEWGRVESIWMYPEVHRVLGFISQSGRRGKEKFAFNLRQLHRVEVERLVVNSDPTPTDTESVALLETLIGHELWNDAGNKVGKIIDCRFSLETGAITDYLFRAEGLRGLTGSVYRLSPTQILKFSKNRVRVSQRTADQFPVDRAGIDHQLSQVTEELRGDLTERFQDRYGEVNQDLQSFSTQTQEQLQHLTVKVSRQVQDLTGQATRKAKAVAQQVQAELLSPDPDPQRSPSPWLDRLQAKARSLTETLQDELHPLAKQVKDKLKPNNPRSPRPGSSTWDVPLDRIPPEDLEDDQPWL